MRAAGEAQLDSDASSAPASRMPSSTKVAVGALAAFAFILRTAIFLRPLAIVDRRFIPDDTYYTLAIARSLAHGHGPTTDAHTLTSGFQPLQGFLMTPVFWFTDNADAALRVDLALMIVVDVATVVVLAWVAYRLAGNAAAITAAALWAVSPAAIAMALGGLETSLALGLEIGVVAAFIWCNDRPTRWRWIVVGAVSGLAVLARIDALLLVALLALVECRRGPRRELWVAGTAGVVIVGPWWIWCLVALGTPFPTSGSAAHNLSPEASFSQLTQSLTAGAVSGGPVGPWDWARARLIEHPLVGVVVFWCIVAAAVTIAALWFRRRSPAWAYAATLPAFAAGLLVFYAWYGVPFYLTRYLSPVALVASLVVAVVVARVVAVPRSGRIVAWGVTGLALLVVGVAVARTHVRDLTRTRVEAARLGSPRFYDSNTGYREVMQRVVPLLPARGTIGGWQSGALSYYAPKALRVVNLDGVTNPDAYAADRHGGIAQYIRDQHVVALVDFPEALTRLAIQLGSLHPKPTVELTARVPADQASPEYGLATVGWPEPPAPAR